MPTVPKVDASTEPETPAEATLDLLFDLVRGAPEADLRAVDAMDSKIVQVFAAGAVLLGLPAAGLPSHPHDSFVIPFILAVVAFAYLAYQTIKGLWRRRFRATMSPHQLWEKYSWDDPLTIKHAFVADVADGWPSNNSHLLEKRKLLNQALIALGAEAVAIGIAMIVSAA